MPSFPINREELTEAIIELNAMSRAQGIIMDQNGQIKTGNSSDADFLCMLIPAPTLARQLTADGLSSYTGKELKSWAEAYDIAPLELILTNL